MHLEIWQNETVNFNPDMHSDSMRMEDGAFRLDAGRILLKPLAIPVHPRRCNIELEVSIKSSGDPWDKSGSLRR